MPETDTQLLLVLGLGFLAACVTAAVVRRRTLTEAGILFALIGVAVGPVGLALIPTIQTDTWDIAVAALSGWVALEVGLAISLRNDGHLAPGALRAGVLYSVVGVLGFSVVAFGVLEVLLATEFDTAWVYPALLIAAASVGAAPGALAGVAKAHEAEGPVRGAGASLARVTRGLAIVLIALAAAVAEPQIVVEGFRALTPAERILLELMLGVTFGFFADVFLASEPNDRRMVTILVGLSLLASGLSAHLGLSPMLVNLLIGASLANYGHLSADRHRAAETLEGPSRKVLLVFLGAAWMPSAEPIVWAVIALLIGARIAMLRIAGGVAGRAFERDHAGFRLIGFTMVAQGAPALAIALAYTHSPHSLAGTIVLSVVLFSAVINDLWAPRAARLVLDEAGEIPTTSVET